MDKSVPARNGAKYKDVSQFTGNLSEKSPFAQKPEVVENQELKILDQIALVFDSKSVGKGVSVPLSDMIPGQTSNGAEGAKSEL